MLWSGINDVVDRLLRCFRCVPSHIAAIWIQSNSLELLEQKRAAGTARSLPFTDVKGKSKKVTSERMKGKRIQDGTKARTHVRQDRKWVCDVTVWHIWIIWISVSWGLTNGPTTWSAKVTIFLLLFTTADILLLSERSGSGEEYITRSFMLCTRHQISFG